VLGVRRRAPGGWMPVVLTPWGWVLLALVIMGAGTAGFAEYSMQPDFCRSCHIMEPYYAAWHSSTHKNVPCADCHFEPGLQNTLKGKWEASSQAVKYITNTYGSKPHAEIRDESCLRSGCHEKRILEGKVKWNAPSARGGTVTIGFDHAPHLSQERRGKNLRCVSCHSQMVQGQHIVVTTDTCFLCHMKGLEHGRHDDTLGGCQACHDAPKGEIRLSTGMFAHKDYTDRGVTCENCHSEVVKGDGSVPRQVCWNCHNQPAQIARYGETVFLHDNHITKHKVECSSCHVQIEHSIAAAAPSKRLAHGPLGDSGSCGQCHEQSHAGPAEMYRGLGGRGVPELASPMSRAQVDCIACHRDQKYAGEAAQVLGQTFKFSPETCVNCHGSKYEGSLEVWRRQIAMELDRAEAAYATALAAVSVPDLAIAPPERLKADRFLDDADYNIRFVRLAHGVHNVNYATAVLNAAIDMSAKARGIAEAAAGGPVPVPATQESVPEEPPAP
jgi:nitrate/TMAO reductase-like tetraheme cytochrome c subunit